MHLFSGALDVDAYAAREEAAARDAGSKEKPSSLADLERRVSELEAVVAELRKRP